MDPPCNVRRGRPGGQRRRAGRSDARVDSEGTTVNPYQLPAGEKHADTSCMDCHKAHASGGVEEHAQKLCRTCHHTGVYARGAVIDEAPLEMGTVEGLEQDLKKSS